MELLGEPRLCLVEGEAYMELGARCLDAADGAFMAEIRGAFFFWAWRSQKGSLFLSPPLFCFLGFAWLKGKPIRKPRLVWLFLDLPEEVAANKRIEATVRGRTFRWRANTFLHLFALENEREEGLLFQGQ